MGWISDLASLPAAVAILVVFTICQWWMTKVTSKNIVAPFKEIVNNHFAHVLEDRKEDRIERKEDRNARNLERQAIEKLIDKIDSL